MTSAQFDRVTVDPEVLGGKPGIRSLRISVGLIVEVVAAGKTTAQIVSEYPYLDAEDVASGAGVFGGAGRERVPPSTTPSA